MLHRSFFSWSITDSLRQPSKLLLGQMQQITSWWLTNEPISTGWFSLQTNWSKGAGAPCTYSFGKLIREKTLNSNVRGLWGLFFIWSLRWGAWDWAGRRRCSDSLQCFSAFSKLRMLSVVIWIAGPIEEIKKNLVLFWCLNIRNKWLQVKTFHFSLTYCYGKINLDGFPI